MLGADAGLGQPRGHLFLIFRGSAPGQAAARGDLTGEGDQPSRDIPGEAKLLKGHGIMRPVEGDDQTRFSFSHDRFTDG